jgi:hypothetical protein
VNDFAHHPIRIIAGGVERKMFLRFVILTLILALAGASFADPVAAAESMYQADSPRLKYSASGLPLIFERNVGQAMPGIKFLSHGNDSLLLISSDTRSFASRAQRREVRVAITRHRLALRPCGSG